MTVKLVAAPSNPEPALPERSRSPLRAQLFTAIQNHSRASRAAEKGRAAIDRANSLVSDCETRLQEATAKIVTAKEAAAKALAVSLRQDSSKAPIGRVTLLRQAEQVCIDDLDAAKSALEHLQASLSDDVDTEARRTASRVTACFNAVIADHIEEVRLPRVKKMIAELVAEVASIQVMADMRPFQFHRGDAESTLAEIVEASERTKPFDDLYPKIALIVETGIRFDTEAADRHPGVGVWKEARENLAHDADYPLPKS
jgi:phosphopantetheinyl transferase (holo-ACP synthase)